EPRQALPCRQQGLLERVLRVQGRAEDPVTVHLQLAPEGADELGERLLVARPGLVHEVGAHQITLSCPLPPPAALSVPTPRWPETGRRRQPPSLAATRCLHP